MKISDNNYCKIKLAFEKYLTENNLDIRDFKTGDFFWLHTNLHIISRNPDSPFLERWKLTSFISDGKPIFDNYELYPDGSNDEHLKTVFKRLQRDIQ